MKRFRYILPAAAVAAALGASVSATAEDLKTEITVDRTVVPVQRPATPLQSVAPSILTPTAGTRTLSLSDFSETASYDNIISPLQPAEYPGVQGTSPYRGYASVAYFPTLNLGASAGYRFITTPRTTLGAWLQYDGVKYKAPSSWPRLYARDKRQSVSNNTLTLGADLLQRFGSRTSLAVAFDYTYAALKSPRLEDEAASELSRHISAFNAAASLHGGAGSKVGYHIGVDFDHFGLGGDALDMPAAYTLPLKGASENITTGRLGIFGQIGRRHYLGLEASGSFLHRNSGGLLLRATPEGTQPVGIGRPEHSTQGIVKIQPYWGFRSAKASARLGVDVNINTINIGSHVHVAPNVLLDWNPASILAVYARFGGGDSFNSQRSLYSRMGAFAPGTFNFLSSNTPVEADFGVNIGPFHGLSLELSGAYACTHNAPMAAMLEYADGSLLGTFVNANISGWSAGARLSYRWRDIAGVSAGVKILPHSYGSATLDNPDRAKTVTTARIEAKPIEKLNLALDYSLRSSRRYYLFDMAQGGGAAPVAQRMKNLSDLKFEGSFDVSEAVTIGLDVENLLCRRVQMLPWLPSQGLHGLLSVNVKF